MPSEAKEWSWEIKPATNIPHVSITELWRYKDLLVRFVKRDHVVSYRQTILGPVWVFLEPLIATYVYFLIFTGIMKVPTGNIPPLIFFLSGIVIWTYFSDTVTGISYTFYQNASIFGKVYFPRIVVPISIAVSKISRLGIQLIMLVAMYIFFVVKGVPLRPTIFILLTPVLILFTAIYSIGVGLILAAMAARYRDVQNLMMFVIRLLMFATPVFYPFSLVNEKYRLLIGLNPLTEILEAFRYALFNSGSVSLLHLLYSAVSSIIIFLLGIVFFGRVEQNVVDTV